MPVLGESLQMKLEGLAIFRSVPILFMIGTDFIRISGGGISAHRLGPLKEWLILDLVKELRNRFCKDRIDSPVRRGRIDLLGFLILAATRARGRRSCRACGCPSLLIAGAAAVLLF